MLLVRNTELLSNEHRVMGNERGESVMSNNKRPMNNGERDVINYEQCTTKIVTRKGKKDGAQIINTCRQESRIQGGNYE